MDVYIVGEDALTLHLIKKILHYASPEFNVISELPARGGQIKSKIENFNQLSLSTPVILLTDLDQHNCPPEMLEKFIPNKNPNFLFNIAIDEAESWIMADRSGFADFFSINLRAIPLSKQVTLGGRNRVIEMDFPYKSSMFLTHELVKHCTSPTIIKQLTPRRGAAKSPEYNTAILPFVDVWNIEEAILNSNSLERMISRLRNLIK